MRADQFLARQHPRAVHLGPHALCRGRRPPRRAQRRDPLAAGDARSARHDARIHEVGLRAPQRPGAGIGRRPRAQHRHDRAARARLHDAAARSARRALGQFPLRVALAPRTPSPPYPGPERDRRSRRADREREIYVSPDGRGRDRLDRHGGRRRLERRARLHHHLRARACR